MILGGRSEYLDGGAVPDDIAVLELLDGAMSVDIFTNHTTPLIRLDTSHEVAPLKVRIN